MPEYWQRAVTSTFFGRLPIEQERDIAKELLERAGVVTANAFLPFVIFNKEETFAHLREIKRKLNQLGI